MAAIRSPITAHRLKSVPPHRAFTIASENALHAIRADFRIGSNQTSEAGPDGSGWPSKADLS